MLARESVFQTDPLHKVEKGGHFAAWEEPQTFSEEVRAGFRTLRSGAMKSTA